MNAKTVTRARYPRGLGKAELLAEWEAQLSLQLVEHEGGCVEWTGPLDDAGGATCHAPKELAQILAINQTQTVVRALWIIKYGKTSNFNLMPACRSPWCVAPEHRLSMGWGRMRAYGLARKRKGEPSDALEWRIRTRLKAEKKCAKFRAYRARRAAKGRPLRSVRKSALSERQHQRKLEAHRVWIQAHRRQGSDEVNARRRAHWAKHADEINAQRRALWIKRADEVNARRRASRAAKKAQAQQVQP